MTERQPAAVVNLEALRALETDLAPDPTEELMDDALLETTDRLVEIERALD